MDFDPIEPMHQPLDRASSSWKKMGGPLPLPGTTCDDYATPVNEADARRLEVTYWSVPS